MTNGIVVGKFYPPHRGHKYLIETACQQVDKVTVIVCDKEGHLIPGLLRADWLKEMVPQAEVIVIDDRLSDDDPKAWAENTVRVLGYIPDIVFTSEDYGDKYAQYMGSRHMLIDKDRKNIAISASKIRANPLVYWDYLEPCVCAYFAKRICVIGAESSGTTTMAKELADYYNTIWVPEFGRTYWEKKVASNTSQSWTTDEFILIAQEQNKLEDEYARRCNKVLICDTNSFATTMWHERYMGYISHKVDALHVRRKYDGYLLTDVDFPFVQDGTRDGEHIRHNMHRRFEEELKKNKKQYILLSGSHEQRLSDAIKACDEIISHVNAL